MKEATPFHLSKWYLDCITADGDAYICYVALLRWRALPFFYSNILIHRSSGEQATSHSLMDTTMPRPGHDGITWQSRAFDFDGLWTARALPFEETLYRDPQGAVHWNCLQPISDVTFRRRNQPGHSGSGYVERLDLTIAPWRLPITTLRWGHFVSDGHWMVWIHWTGDSKKSLLLCDARCASEFSVTDNELSFDRGALSFLDHAVLRKGPILSAALANIPQITSLFAPGMLQMNECKWLSRAELQLSGMAPCQGWTIHEVVDFEAR